NVGPAQTYTTIQPAITAASNGDVVLIHDGTYTGAGNKHLTISPSGGPPKSIIVGSINGAPATVIDCQGSDSAFVFFNGTETNATVVAGLTITNCKSAGIRLSTSSKPTIASVTFTANSNTFGTGGGILGDGASVSPRILGSTFSANDLGAQNGAG